MKIKHVLRAKGDEVASIRPQASVRDALALLADRGVGALVVSCGKGHVDGIVSERDIVRRLHDRGTAILDGPVEAIMSTDVHTCRPEDDLDSLMGQMTANRIRHVPVMADGSYVGIVSIGDVVKARVDELVTDRRALEEYIGAR